MSRKKPILDYVLIEKLANLGCPDYEIAYAIGYTPAHFNKLKKKDALIRGAIDRGSNGIKISLRRAQLRAAIPKEDDKPGNVTMLIWLGKQYLHQSDHLKLSGDEDSPININITQDLSKLSDEELRQLDGITAKLESKEGIGKEAPS